MLGATTKSAVLALIVALAVVLVLCVAGAIALTFHGDEVPDQLWNLAIFLAGALAGALTTRSTLGSRDVPVESLPAPANSSAAPATPAGFHGG